MVVIYLSYHVIWQSKTDLVIWLVYDSHMTWVVIWTSYTCHITGSDMVSYRWYIQAYTSHMTSGTDESYESYMTVYVCRMTSCFWAGGARRSGPQQNRAWNAAAHRVWIARVFIVPVHHSTRRCHWAAVTASLGQATAAEDDAGGHKVAPPTSAALVVSWLCRAALAADCRVQKQMTSVGTKMN